MVCDMTVYRTERRQKSVLKAICTFSYPHPLPVLPLTDTQLCKTQGKKETLFMLVVCPLESTYIVTYENIYLPQLCIDLRIKNCTVFQELFI